MEALPRLSLSQFEHISVRLPSYIENGFEEQLVHLAASFPPNWLLVTHPNVIVRGELWRELGSRLCIENMDKRKPIGQTARDLAGIFGKLPEATFCFDLGHVHQIDPTMGEAVLIVGEFKSKLRQLHVSEVNSQSKHDPISRESAYAFSMISRLIPKDIPVILESRIEPLTPSDVQAEINFARQVLGDVVPFALAGDEGLTCLPRGRAVFGGRTRKGRFTPTPPPHAHPPPPRNAPAGSPRRATRLLSLPA